MYSPAYYRENDLAELDRLAAAHPFATLITVRDGAPFATHLPVLYARDGARVTIRGHWARANPQWRASAMSEGAASVGATSVGAASVGAASSRDIPLSEALLILRGPHAYVSPSWYPDKEEAARVPTWNYAVAHLHGELEVFDDTDSLGTLVSELSDVHEAAHGLHWRFEPERTDHRVQLKGIVGFRLVASHIELKFKLNQNHPEANRRGVIAGLTAHGGDARLALAELMRARLDQPAAPE
ncbi:MAG: FMN-binding negative transcriptional regulator [Proteobacteria bacterium]|nr:FMN-binding negative transcriptional regulator [Pseudomonadota bacterium]MBS0464666.1 FMN-binding negative transcriptional regulator [Pseudomonadota bacterium]